MLFSRKHLIILVLLVSLLSSCVEEMEIVKVESIREPKTPKVMVHYMPWYQAPPVSDSYGWHWHMGFFEPYKLNEKGLPQLASQFTPLTGAYDSSDPDILEYQTLLMHLAGIDGVIIDWYGIMDSRDYGDIHRASKNLFSKIVNSDLKFAVCYEDQIIPKLIEVGDLEYKNAIEHGKDTISWLSDNWFNKEAYLKIDGRPVFMNFGPQFFKRPGQWQEIFSEADPKPMFITLDDHFEKDADGFYPWPPMYNSVNGVLTLDSVMSYLHGYYKDNQNKEYLVTSAFPGFHDIYKEAGIGSSYGYLDANNGKTLEMTLKAAAMSNPDVIQVATWNDYGEGTVVEPTVETGYDYLEQLQEFKKGYDKDFKFKAKDLRVAIQFYRFRRDSKKDSEIQKKLNSLYKAVVSKDYKEYKILVKELGLDKKNLPENAIQMSKFKTPDKSIKLEDLGTNEAIGKSTRDNGHIGAFVSKNANDGDVKTYWEGAQNSFPNDFIIDLGKDMDIDVIRLKLNPLKLWGKRVQNIEVLGSPNNTNYATIVKAKDYTFDPEFNSNSIDIIVNTNVRYLKLSCMSNTDAKAFQIAELEVYSK